MGRVDGYLLAGGESEHLGSRSQPDWNGFSDRRKKVKSTVISSQHIWAEKDGRGGCSEGSSYIHPHKIYVRNFPSSLGKEDLTSLFKAAGKIEDIHIPRGPNRAGKSYCFVTFSKEADIANTIVKFSGYKFDKERLFVAQAKEKPGRSSFRSAMPMNGGEDLRTALKMKRFNSSCKKFVNGTIDPGLEALSRKAWMGVSIFARSAGIIQREIGAKGVFDIELRDLGNRVIMINCPDMAFERSMIEEDWAWLFSWVHMVHGKENCFQKGGFFKWICIKGVPIQGWKKENFEEVAGRFGDPLMVHPESLSGFSFEKGLVLIHTNSNINIQEEVAFIIKDQTYQVEVSDFDGHLVPHLEEPPSPETSSESNSGKEDTEETLSSFVAPTFNEPPQQLASVNEAQLPTSVTANIVPGEKQALTVSFKDPSINETDFQPLSGDESQVPIPMEVNSLMDVENEEAVSKIAPEDSERTISYVLRYPKRKGKGGKKKGLKKMSNAMNNRISINGTSEEAIARQSYGPNIIDYEGALMFCKNMGFNTKGNDELLRDHLSPLNDVQKNWQNFVADLSEDSDQGVP